MDAIGFDINNIPEDSRHRPEYRFPRNHEFWNLSGQVQSILADIYGSQSMIKRVDIDNQRRQELIDGINYMIGLLPQEHQRFANL